MHSTTSAFKFSRVCCAYALLASAISFGLLAGPSHATIMGDTVVFSGITESSTTPGDPLPLYGTPSASGNTLTFPTTSSFSALSQDGMSSDNPAISTDLTDGKLELMIEAKPGYLLTSVDITELVVGLVSAPLGGDAFINVFSSGGVDVDGGPIIGFALSFSAGDTLQHSVDVSPAPTGGLTTIGEASVGLPSGTTKVTLEINNILTALTTDDPGATALIDKKSFSVDVDTELVPEPSTLALIAFGMLGVVATRRAS